MIGYAVRRNRLMKQGDSNDLEDGSRSHNVLTANCNLLFVAAGVFFIVGAIVMIPGFFGDTNFFIYSLSSFGIGLVILTFACFCTTIIDKEEQSSTSTQHRSQQGQTTPVLPASVSPVTAGCTTSNISITPPPQPVTAYLTSHPAYLYQSVELS